MFIPYVAAQCFGSVAAAAAAKVSNGEHCAVQVSLYCMPEVNGCRHNEGMLRQIKNKERIIHESVAATFVDHL